MALREDQTLNSKMPNKIYWQNVPSKSFVQCKMPENLLAESDLKMISMQTM
jgi:hypothetical protein